MKKFISFSGGVESTTMCILYGKGATAIWCDTGDEEPEMYERINECEIKLKEIHNGDFKLIRIIPKVITKKGTFSTLLEGSIIWSLFPSQTKRWCTIYLKIKPIDDFLKAQGDCELMIGFNADEEPTKDRTGNFMKCKNVYYTYPLYNEGKTRIDCEDILYDYDLHPEFPIYMQRGGCRKCFYKGEKELKAKYIFNKKGFLEDKAYEIEMNEKSNRKKFYAINISAGSYQTIQNKVEQEIELWGLEEVKKMYKEIITHKPCGAFCHR